MQSIDFIEAYEHRTRKDLVIEKKTKKKKLLNVQ